MKKTNGKKKPTEKSDDDIKVAIKIGHGVFGWDSGERRSNRYGSIHLSGKPFDGSLVTRRMVDHSALEMLTGKRIRVTCKVVDTRESGHVGDLFLRIFPSTPSVGDVIDLGVGVLVVSPGYDGSPDIALMPDDGRAELWIDPRLLYRLHDQTVDVYAMETEEPCSPAPQLSVAATDGSIDNGDGSMQFKTRGCTNGAFSVLANVENLGDGLHILTPPGSGGAGTRHGIRKM